MSYVLPELPSAGVLQGSRQQWLVRALSARYQGYFVPRVVLVHPSGDDDAVDDVVRG